MRTRSEISDKALKATIKKAVTKATDENMALGITSTALVDGKVVEISPDQSVKIIKDLKIRTLRKPLKKRFTLD